MHTGARHITLLVPLTIHTALVGVVMTHTVILAVTVTFTYMKEYCKYCVVKNNRKQSKRDSLQ